MKYIPLMSFLLISACNNIFEQSRLNLQQGCCLITNCDPGTPDGGTTALSSSQEDCNNQLTNNSYAQLYHCKSASYNLGKCPAIDSGTLPGGTLGTVLNPPN